LFPILQVSESLGSSVKLVLVVPLSSLKGCEEALGDVHDGFRVIDTKLEGYGCRPRGDGGWGVDPSGGWGFIGGVDWDIGHALVWVVEWAGVVFAEECVLANMALRELVVEQEEEAV
jgi:hypothetical protein